jgi:hypothetical protein
LKRRQFLLNSGSMVAATCLAPWLLKAERKPGHEARSLAATLTVDKSTKTATVPMDFTGLSYESAQLANPAFFAAENRELIRLFRALGKEGVLRLGGGTSEFTAFTTQEQTGPPPFDEIGPDTSKNVKADTPITPASLRNLRAFLDATGWGCLYGLNLGRGTVERVAEEASYVQKILGPRLIAFQLGNEPDAWRNRYRPSTWSYADYWKEWFVAYQAVLQRAPQAKFAGPDVSNKMAYVTGFAEDVKKSAPEVVMLTSHYYAMGPAGAKGVTMDRLLSPDPKLERDLKIAMEAARYVGLPYRMSEGNSCWNGGQPGVSDTLASALWVLDVMLNFAEIGCAGVNLHGGGNGFYTPIAGGLQTGFTRRPEYYGMLLAKEFVGATMVQSRLECESDQVRAYVGEKNGVRLVMAINKTERAVDMKTPLQRSREQWLLTGPAIDAKQGVTLTGSRETDLREGVLRVSPHSAVLIRA